jgi:F0F1-type ATP synthase assembly protein I
MREFFITQSQTSTDWFIFLGILLLFGLAAAIFIVWLKASHKLRTHRHKRGRHHRHGRKTRSATPTTRTPDDHVRPPAP